MMRIQPPQKIWGRFLSFDGITRSSALTVARMSVTISATDVRNDAVDSPPYHWDNGHLARYTTGTTGVSPVAEAT